MWWLSSYEYSKNAPYYPVTNSGYTIPKVGLIKGRVTDREGIPIPWATIRVLGKENRSATTDGNGDYKIALPVGSYKIQAEKSEYIGSNVLSITLNSGDTLQADFVLRTKDLTPPTRPVVTDDGDVTSDKTKLHAKWSASDPESGIVEYQYAIGTTSGGTNVVGWTSVGLATEVTKNGLNLTWGQTYYFAVKAKNGVGLWSKVGISNGIRVDDSTPPTKPVVTDDGYTTSDKTKLHAKWSASDPESGITEYQYQLVIEITPVSRYYLVGWTSVGLATEVTKSGLNLTWGETCYFAVKAKNGAGLWSKVGESNGITVKDAAPPVVNITSPANGATVKGTVTVTANASDNVGVTQVEFYIDNSLKANTSNPYAYDWDTTSSANGDHIIKVIAYDQARNKAEKTCQLKVDNVARAGCSIVDKRGVVTFENEKVKYTWSRGNIGGYFSHITSAVVKSTGREQLYTTYKWGAMLYAFSGYKMNKYQWDYIITENTAERVTLYTACNFGPFTASREYILEKGKQYVTIKNTIKANQKIKAMYAQVANWWAPGGAENPIAPKTAWYLGGYGASPNFNKWYLLNTKESQEAWTANYDTDKKEGGGHIWEPDKVRQIYENEEGRFPYLEILIPALTAGKSHTWQEHLVLIDNGDWQQVKQIRDELYPPVKVAAAASKPETADEEKSPEKTGLAQNYPNPMNPETWIPFSLAEKDYVTIRIYNLSGQLIRTLDLGEREPGRYFSRNEAAYWDGKDEAGHEVASGTYLYQLQAKAATSTRKMIILK
ncbi:MAG: Ig-like domain-containing protein [bacterium]